MAQLKLDHLTDKEKNEILKDALGSDYNAAGNNLPILKNVIDKIDLVDNGFSFVELIPVFNRILDLKIVSVVAEGASVLSIFLFPVSALIDILNAYETGARLYSYRGVAYTLTSWAFGDVPVHSSRTILNNLSAGRLVPPDLKYTIEMYNKAWKKAESDTLSKMNSITAQNKINPAYLKLFICALADNNRQKLCLDILRSFEKKLSFQDNIVWRAGYKLIYPL